MLQVPLALLAILTVGTFLTLPRSPTGDLRAKFARIDFAGAFTLVASIFLLLFGLDRGGNVAWRDTTTIASLSGAFVFFALFVLVEVCWAREPCAPKRIVTNRTLLASYLANLFSNAAGITLIFSVSLYLQAVQGARAGEVGLILLPTVFGGVAGSLGIGLIMQATGKYYVATIASFALMLFGTVVVALVTGPWKYTLVGLSFGAEPLLMSIDGLPFLMSVYRHHRKQLGYRGRDHQYPCRPRRQCRARRPSCRHSRLLPLPFPRLGCWPLCGHNVDQRRGPQYLAQASVGG